MALKTDPDTTIRTYQARGHFNFLAANRVANRFRPLRALAVCDHFLCDLSGLLRHRHLFRFAHLNRPLLERPAMHHADSRQAWLFHQQLQAMLVNSAREL